MSDLMIPQRTMRPSVAHAANEWFTAQPGDIPLRQSATPGLHLVDP